MTTHFEEININSIRTRSNYRQSFDEKKLKELAASIKEHGIIQPMVLRPAGNKYEIVAGERRVRASKLADKVTIPAVIRDLTDAVEIIELQLIENIQKEGVSYMEEAYGLQKLRDKGTLDVKEIAKRIGKSEAYVYYAIRLTAMSEEARKFCEKGWIGKGAAFELAKLKNEAQQTQAANDLARTNREKLITSSGAKHYIRDNFGSESANALRKRRVSKFGSGSNDYTANWKYHLVRFTADQFERFKNIVRGRTETEVISEAVDLVMRRENEEQLTEAM